MQRPRPVSGKNGRQIQQHLSHDQLHVLAPFAHRRQGHHRGHDKLECLQKFGIELRAPRLAVRRREDHAQRLGCLALPAHPAKKIQKLLALFLGQLLHLGHEIGLRHTVVEPLKRELGRQRLHIQIVMGQHHDITVRIAVHRLELPHRKLELDAGLSAQDHADRVFSRRPQVVHRLAHGRTAGDQMLGPVNHLGGTAPPERRIGASAGGRCRLLFLAEQGLKRGHRPLGIDRL